jgi:3-oxoacyl-[acyl-carrier protein] reductase
MARLSKLSRSIAGKVALVTGAGSGMGRATAYLFADEGAHVACADINGQEAEATAAAIREAGGSAAAWGLDVADRAAVEAAVGEIVQRFGGLDILVNNAGVSTHCPIDAEDYEARWERTVAVNITAHTLTIRAALLHLRKTASGGRIVNIASTEGLGATSGISPYTATKHAVIGLTRSLAVELGKEGITVNCICPGAIRTGMTAKYPEEAKQKFARRRIPNARYADPEEVAHATLSLVLPAASYINGVALPVDAGLTIKNA